MTHLADLVAETAAALARAVDDDRRADWDHAYAVRGRELYERRARLEAAQRALLRRMRRTHGR